MARTRESCRQAGGHAEAHLAVYLARALSRAHSLPRSIYRSTAPPLYLFVFCLAGGGGGGARAQGIHGYGCSLRCCWWHLTVRRGLCAQPRRGCCLRGGLVCSPHRPRKQTANLCRTASCCGGTQTRTTNISRISTSRPTPVRLAPWRRRHEWGFSRAQERRRLGGVCARGASASARWCAPSAGGGGGALAAATFAVHRAAVRLARPEFEPGLLRPGWSGKLNVRDLINEPYGLGVNSIDVEASFPAAKRRAVRAGRPCEPR